MKASVVDSAETSTQVVSVWWHDRVFTTIIAVAAMAWGSALCLSIIKQPFLLHKLAVPLAVSLYKPGLVPSPEGVEEFQRFLSMLAYTSGLVGGLTLSYAGVWRYLLRRLPTGAPSMQVSSTASLSTLECCCLTGIGALAVILRLHHITRGLTLDELVTTLRFVEVDSLWTTLSGVGATSIDELANNHLANSLLAYLSQQLLGRSEWVLRLPALLLGLTSLYVLWAFTRRLAGPALAVLATAGLAFSPAHIFWSVTARGYVGMLLFTLVSTSFYLQILHRPSWRKGLLFTVSNVLAIFFHLFAALVVVTQLLFLLYLAVRELATGRSGRILSVDSCRILYLAFPAIVGMSVACYALIAHQYFARFRELGHGSLDLFFPLKVLALLSIGPARSVSLGRWMLVGVMGALCIIGWIAFRQRWARFAGYLVCLAISSFLIVMLARPRFLESRFFLYLLPFYLILLGEGLLTVWQGASAPERVRRTVLQGCCLLVGGAMLGTWLVRVWVDFPRLRHSFRDAAWAMQATPPEMGLCVIGVHGWILRYYLKRDYFIPRNREDFDQFVQRYPAITCADLSFIAAEVPAYNRDIVAFLSQHGASSLHQEIVVYTFGKAP